MNANVIQTEEFATKMEFAFVIYGIQDWIARNVKNQ